MRCLIKDTISPLKNGLHHLVTDRGSYISYAPQNSGNKFTGFRRKIKMHIHLNYWSQNNLIANTLMNLTKNIRVMHRFSYNENEVLVLV